MVKQHRKILDDLFDAYSILAGGNYVSLYDVIGQVTRWSPAAVELFDLPGEYIPDGAMNWADYVHPEDRKYYQEAMSALLATNTLTYDITYRVRTKDGRYGVFRNVGAVLRDNEGNPSLVGGMIVNEGLQENTDPVTVIRNQYGFFNDLSEAMRTDRTSIILLMSINNLARINEYHGYSHGNRVLQQVAWLLQEIVGDAGTVYRMDGAKFSIVTDRLGPAEVDALYERLRRKLLNTIRVDGIRHSLAVSGGTISVHGLRMDARSVFAGLRFAQHESRARKHGALVSFDGGDMLELAGAVRESVLNGCAGFSLHYQPVVAAPGEQFLGVEAILRWQGEPYGDVAPMRFLPVLEQDAIFEELGNWILLQTMRDGKKFLERNPDFIIGVNISEMQLAREYFADSVLQLVAQTGFPARNLCLELTKECRTLDLRHVREVVETLQAKGIRVILDDFGSGCDSLEFLKTLRTEFVKLEPSLVAALPESETERRAMRGLTELAAAYGANVCVKEVETPEICAVLRDYPVHSLQGFCFSPPLPLDEAVKACFPDK